MVYGQTTLGAKYEPLMWGPYSPTLLRFRWDLVDGPDCMFQLVLKEHKVPGHGKLGT